MIFWSIGIQFAMSMVCSIDTHHIKTSISVEKRVIHVYSNSLVEVEEIETYPQTITL